MCESAVMVTSSLASLRRTYLLILKTLYPIMHTHSVKYSENFMGHTGVTWVTQYFLSDESPASHRVGHSLVLSSISSVAQQAFLYYRVANSFGVLS